MKLLWITVPIVLSVQLCMFAGASGAEETDTVTEVELGVMSVVEERESTPYSRSIISEEEIETSNPADAGDMLKKLPGISAKRTGLLGLDPVMRGFREDQLNVLIDGTKVWGACPGRMDPPTSQIGVDEIEAIEVIRGPFSVRHGAGTLGGVINLVTKQPRHYEQLEVHGKLSAGYDNVAQGKKGSFSLYGGDKPWDFRLSISGRDYDDYDSAENTVPDSSFEDVGYSAKIGAAPADNHRLDLAVSGADGRDIHYPARLMDSEKHDSFLSNLKYSWQGDNSQGDNSQGDNSQGDKSLSFTASLYYNTAQHTMNNDDRDSAALMEMETENQSDTYGGKLESVFEPNSKNSLAAGIDYYNLVRDADRTRVMKMGVMRTTMEDKPWNNASIFDWGAYAEYKRMLLPQLELVLGGRLDLVEADSDVPNDTFLNLVGEDDLEQAETNLSGNIGLVYGLTKNIDLTAAMGRGVRTADANERYSFFFPSSKYFDDYDYLGNPGLDPEQSLEFDVGCEAGFDRASVGFSLFYSRVKDYITGEIDSELIPKTVGALGVKRYVNVDAALMGFELEGSLKITDRLSLRGDLSYTEGENRDSDTYLPQVPPFEGNAAARYDYGKWGSWTEISGRFVSRQDKIDPGFGESETPGFSTFDIMLGVTPFDNCTLMVGADNIFDKSYSEHLNGNDVSTGDKLLEPGRNFFAKATWEF